MWVTSASKDKFIQTEPNSTDNCDCFILTYDFVLLGTNISHPKLLRHGSGISLTNTKLLHDSHHTQNQTHHSLFIIKTILAFTYKHMKQK